MYPNLKELAQEAGLLKTIQDATPSMKHAAEVKMSDNSKQRVASFSSSMHVLIRRLTLRFEGMSPDLLNQVYKAIQAGVPELANQRTYNSFRQRVLNVITDVSKQKKTSLGGPITAALEADQARYNQTFARDSFFYAYLGAKLQKILKTPHTFEEKRLALMSLSQELSRYPTSPFDSRYANRRKHELDVIGAYVDIVNRKAAEALAKKEQRDQLLQCVPQAIEKLNALLAKAADESTPIDTLATLQQALVDYKQTEQQLTAELPQHDLTEEAIEQIEPFKALKASLEEKIKHFKPLAQKAEAARQQAAAQQQQEQAEREAARQQAQAAYNASQTRHWSVQRAKAELLRLITQGMSGSKNSALGFWGIRNNGYDDKVKIIEHAINDLAYHDAQDPDKQPVCLEVLVAACASQRNIFKSGLSRETSAMRALLSDEAKTQLRIILNQGQSILSEDEYKKFNDMIDTATNEALENNPSRTLGCL